MNSFKCKNCDVDMINIRDGAYKCPKCGDIFVTSESSFMKKVKMILDER